MGEQTTDGDFKFPERIRPNWKAFSRAVIGVLGWRIMDIRDVEKGFLLRPDGTVLESDILREQKQQISIPTKVVLRNLVTGDFDHHAVITQLITQFVGHCWEIMRVDGLVSATTEIPEVQFYRHVRNGGFHGNRFYLKGDEPRFPASWRGLEITRPA